MGNGHVGKCSIPICRPFTLDFLLVFLFVLFVLFCFAPHLSPKLSQFLPHFVLFYFVRTVNTKKRRPHADLEGTTRGSLSKREAKNIAGGVEDVFFSSVRGRVFFRAKRRRRRRRRSRAFIRSGDFFFSQRGVQKRVLR